VGNSFAYLWSLCKFDWLDISLEAEQQERQTHTSAQNTIVSQNTPFNNYDKIMNDRNSSCFAFENKTQVEVEFDPL
jgi:hypothetical protein